MVRVAGADWWGSGAMMRRMWECCGCCVLYTTNVVLRGGLPRLTSIGVAYLEVRELGFLSPSTRSLQRLYTLGDTTSPWGGVRAGHGLGARAGLVLRPDCVVVLEVDLTSVAHAVAWD